MWIKIQTTDAPKTLKKFINKSFKKNEFVFHENSLKYGAFDYVIKDDDAHLNVSLAITKILMLKSMVTTETKRK